MFALVCIYFYLPADHQRCHDLQSNKDDQNAIRILTSRVEKLALNIENARSNCNQLETTQQRTRTATKEETKLVQDVEAFCRSSESLRRRATLEVEQRRKSIAAEEENTTGGRQPRIRSYLPNKSSLAALAEDQAYQSMPGLERPMSSRLPCLCSGQVDFDFSADPAQQSNYSNNAFDDMLRRAKTTSPPRPNAPHGSTYSLRSDFLHREDSQDDTRITSEDFERAMADSISTAEEKKKGFDKPFSDDDFDDFSRLLRQVGKKAWSERPRTYIVLRMIGEVQAMDSFIIEGCKDVNFPYDGEGSIPSCLKGVSARQKFLQKQNLVLSPRTVDLVTGGAHRHLSRWFPCLLQGTDLLIDNVQAEVQTTTLTSSGNWGAAALVKSIKCEAN